MDTPGSGNDLVMTVVWWWMLWQMAKVTTHDGGGSIDSGGDGISISNSIGNDVKSNGGLR